MASRQAPALDTMPAGEAARLSSESPATDATSTTPDDACKQDEERLARLRQAPSSEEVARFAQELRCGTSWPQVLALTGEVVAPSPPNSESVSKDAAAATNTANASPTALDTSAASKATVRGAPHWPARERKGSACNESQPA